MNTSKIGPSEQFLPPYSEGELFKEELLLASASSEGNTVRFTPGRYLLEQDLWLDKPNTVYDMTGVTLLSREGAEVTAVAAGIAVKGLFSYVPFRAEEEADGIILSCCRLEGGATLYPTETALVNCVLNDRVELYAEKAYVVENRFEKGELEMFDPCCTLFSGNLLADCPVTVSYGRNDVFFGNRFVSSSLTANHCFYLTLAQNQFEAGYTLESCQNTLVTSNHSSPVIHEGEHTYGDDLPKNLPEFGCDESSLPPKGYTRFMGILPQKEIRTVDAETLESRIPAGVFLNGVLKSDRSVLLPPGIYRLPKGEKAHIFMKNIENLSLYAYGVEFLCEDYTVSAIGMQDCKKVSIYGPSVDFEEVSNTQGPVVKVEDEVTLLWQPDDGFPDTLCDPTRYPETGAAEGFRKGSDRPFEDCWVASKEKLGQITRLTFNRPHKLREKDKLIFRGNFAHVVLMHHCEGILFEDITLYNGSGFGFMEFTGEGGTVLRRALLTPGMPPVAGGPERLISVCDATHSTCMRKGISVYDSLFEKMTDDATNVNGCYGDVLFHETLDGNTLLGYGTGTSRYTSLCDDFRVGDLILVYTRAGKLLYSGKALKATQKEGDRKYVLAEGLVPIEAEAAIQNASANGYGFVFENSSFANNRSRGLLIKAWGGAVRHCTLSDHGMSALLIKAEIEDGWGECGFTQDFIAEDNLIRQSGYFTGNDLHSPIHITGDCPPTDDPAYHNQKRIVLRHNRIEDRYNRYAILVSNAENVVLEGNSIGPRVASYREFASRTVNADYPKDPQPPICLRSSTGIILTDNILPDGCEDAVEKE